MFLGILPAWVGDLFSILGLPAILLAIVLWFLNSKGANRKLVVEEGSLKKSEFDSVTTAQNSAIARLEREAKEAKEEGAEALDRLDVMDTLYEEMRESIHKMRSMIRRIVSQTGYVMTPDDIAELEATKPPPRPPRKVNA